MTARKTVALTIQTFVDKVISLLINTLSRFVIALFPRRKCLLISWLQSPSTVILESRKVKSFIRFLRRQVRWPGIPISLRIFQFVMIHTVKGFQVISEAEVDIFLEFPCFFYNPTNAGNLISGSSAFSKPCLYIWKFSVHILLKPSLKAFQHNRPRRYNEHNCVVLWTSFGIALFWGLEWKLTFSSPVATAEFSKFAGILSAALSQHHLSGFEIAQLEIHHLH